MELLSKIQQKLKAPKNQTNAFGGYKYRSCEDILEAVKPLLNGATLIINDEVVQLGDRYYVKATATISYKEQAATVTAYAREAENKKGMDEAQITGAASSYARKYALNGLFLIDDTKDADSMDNTEKQAVSAPAAKEPKETKAMQVKAAEIVDAFAQAKNLMELEEMRTLYRPEVNKMPKKLVEWIKNEYKATAEKIEFSPAEGDKNE